MIAKIMTGDSVAGMVKYNSNKVNGKREDDKAQFLGAYNMTDPGTRGIIASIIARNSKNNKRVIKPNIHISLNFPKEEQLTNEKILEVAHRYMELMQFSEQPYAIYRHYDRVHPHIHIVSTQIDINGKKINDSNIIYKSIKRTRQIEKEFDLIPLESKKEIRTQVTQARGTIDYINISLRKVLEQKPTNFYELDKQLQQFGILRVPYKEGHYFEYATTPLESFDPIESKIKVQDLEFPYYQDYFDNEFKKNTNEKEHNTKQVQAKIYSITQSLRGPLPIEDLKTLFIKKGLALEFQRIRYGEKQGNINKLFIKDLKSGITYSATDLNLRTAKFINSYLLDTPTKPAQQEDPIEEAGILGRSPYYEAPREITTTLFTDLINLLGTQAPNQEQEASLKKKKKLN